MKVQRYLAALLVSAALLLSVGIAHAADPIPVTSVFATAVVVPAGATHPGIQVNIEGCDMLGFKLRFNKPRLADGRFDQSVDMALTLTDANGAQYITDNNSNIEYWLVFEEACVPGIWNIQVSNQSPSSMGAVLSVGVGEFAALL